MANKIRFFSSFAGGTKRKHTENGVLIWQNGMLGDADFDFTDPELRNVRNELSQMSSFYNAYDEYMGLWDPDNADPLPATLSDYTNFI